MNKNKLYQLLIDEISNVLKHSLDETLTTFPLTKSNNYILKLKNNLNILIISDRKEQNNLSDDFLLNNYYDDIQLDIFKNDKLCFTKEEIQLLSDKLLLLGYSLLTTYIDNDTEHLIYTPNMQNLINLNKLTNLKYLYHICPEYVVNKIKKNGFCPKSKNSVFKYDPRIHFLLGDTSKYELENMTFLLDQKNKSKGNNHKYYLIKIKIPDNIKFYKDLDSKMGIYTKENISPKYITFIKEIKPISFIEFLNRSFLNQITEDAHDEFIDILY